MVICIILIRNKWCGCWGIGRFGRSGSRLSRALSRPHRLFHQPSLNGSEFLRRHVTLRLRFTQVSEEFVDAPSRTLIFTKQRTQRLGDPCQNSNRKYHANDAQRQPHFVLRQHLAFQTQQISHDLPPTRTRFPWHRCIIWCRSDILKEQMTKFTSWLNSSASVDSARFAATRSLRSGAFSRCDADCSPNTPLDSQTSHRRHCHQAGQEELSVVPVASGPASGVQHA